MKVWMGIVIALALVLLLFYISSARVQKLRADNAAATVQTG